MKDSKQIMANNIKYYMEKKGVTNQQICDALDFKYTTFIDWINAVTYPRIGKIEIMADYFGIKKSDLIEEHVTREQHDTNSEIVEVIFKLRTSPELLKLCTILKDLDKEQITSITAMIQQLYGKNQ